MRTNEFGINPQQQQHPHVPHPHTNRKTALLTAAAATAAVLIAIGIGASPWHLLILLLLFALYIVPSLVAVRRHARNTGSIIAINLLLGWLLVGWVVALAMALADTHRPAPTEAPR